MIMFNIAPTENQLGCRVRSYCVGVRAEASWFRVEEELFSCSGSHVTCASHKSSYFGIFILRKLVPYHIVSMSAMSAAWATCSSWSHLGIGALLLRLPYTVSDCYLRAVESRSAAAIAVRFIDGHALVLVLVFHGLTVPRYCCFCCGCLPLLLPAVLLPG